MQLWCELKQRYTNISFTCYRLGSLLLVMLFLSISVLQSLHSHNRVAQTEQSSADDDMVSNSDQCKICDYLLHKQDKQLFYSFATVVVPTIPDAIVYNDRSSIGNYKFTLQGFTNKGPPTVA